MQHEPTTPHVKNLRDYALIHTLCSIAGYKPRVHGNGFIQLDISPTMRIHVWADDRIPRQKVSTPIHDHQFSFTSHILRGQLRNVVYRYNEAVDGLLDRAYTHKVYQAFVRDGQDTVLSQTGDMVSLETTSFTTQSWGTSYSMQAGEIHESIPLARQTVTVIKKDGPSLSQSGMSPRVFVPLGVEPDNAFNRNTAASVELLWQIVEDALS